MPANGVLVGALLLGFSPLLGTIQTDGPPDIIAIMTDDMRADDWRMLDDTQRVVGGTWYPNFVYTTPLCCPFRATFHTGQYAHNHGIRHNKPGWKLFREQEDDTLAVALDAVGYHTAYAGRYMNEFDSSMPPPGWDDWRADNRRLSSGRETYVMTEGYATDVYRDWAVDIIDHAPIYAPLFLTVGFRAPHSPWIPATRHQDVDVGSTISSDDADRKRTLLAVDEAVVAIAQAMGPRWDDACVFVFTDNGFLLGEHGTKGKSIWWDEATRVPLLARCDELRPGIDDRLAGSIDLAPTILRAADAALKREVDGRPLQESWDRDGILIEDWSNDSSGKPRTPFVAIKGKDWVYVTPESLLPRFYRDPGETEDVIGALTESERGAYSAWLDDLRDCAGDECFNAEHWPLDPARQGTPTGSE